MLDGAYRQLSSAVDFDTVEVICFSRYISLAAAKKLMKEGKKPEHLEKTPDDKTQKISHSKARN